MRIMTIACWLLLAVFLAGCAGTVPPPAAVTHTPAASVTAEAPLATVPPAAIVPPATTMLAAATSQPPLATAAPTTGEQLVNSETQIRIIIGDTILTGRLWDNAPARDLAAQLPLTLTFSDYNSLEKIASLPQRLATEGMPAGDDPLPRTVVTAPWGNLVYYGDVGCFNGIVESASSTAMWTPSSAQTGDFTAQ